VHGIRSLMLNQPTKTVDATYINSIWIVGWACMSDLASQLCPRSGSSRKWISSSYDHACACQKIQTKTQTKAHFSLD